MEQIKAPVAQLQKQTLDNLSTVMTDAQLQKFVLLRQGQLEPRRVMAFALPGNTGE